MAKNNYSYKARRNDTLINRMVAVFVLMSVAIFALLTMKDKLLSSAFIDYLGAYMKVYPYFFVLPLILFAVSLFFFVKKRQNGVDESLKVFSSAFILSVAATLLVISTLISSFPYKGYVPSIIFVILVSVLYFIAISFPGSYFVMTLFNALGAFAIYALNLISPIDHRVQDIITRILVIACAVLFFGAFLSASKKDGTFCGIRILAPGASIIPLLVALILFVAFVLLGMFSIGSYVLFDFIIGLETIVFALFYAIKMLK
ncbi:MAG: hypothetical protein IIV81_01910 [Clostridia bacterium]|nr:hypothetical protein [Clostridia bacterium]